MKKANIRKGINIFVVITAYALLFIGLNFAWKSGLLKWVTQGPNIIQAVTSPDQKFVAYVQEHPSLDPPNQALYVERSDKTHFLRVAKLAGDIDSIIKAVWSPDSQIVVFHSRCYLTAVRVSDWKIIRIYLGKEWKRHKPKHGSTFAGAQPIKKVNSIAFPETDCFSYNLEGDETSYTVLF